MEKEIYNSYQSLKKLVNDEQFNRYVWMFFSEEEICSIRRIEQAQIAYIQGNGM